MPISSEDGTVANPKERANEQSTRMFTSSLTQCVCVCVCTVVVSDNLLSFFFLLLRCSTRPHELGTQ